MAQVHKWDILVKLTHWTVAVLFLSNYFFDGGRQPDPPMGRLWRRGCSGCTADVGPNRTFTF